MKIYCVIGAILFSLFGYWQLNDLGQYGTQWWQGWLLTYLFTALVNAVTVFKRLPKFVYFGAAALALAHAVYRSFSIQFQETVLYNPENPAGNETGGLLIVCIWLCVLGFWKRSDTI